MSITIYDIAEEADVSIATVSRAFNNHPRVSSKTRKRIFEIAERHNYQPNASAQSLARKNTYLISAIIPMMANYFFLEVIRGLQDRIFGSEFDLTIYPVIDPGQAPAQLERAMQRGRSEGMMLFSTWLTDDQADWLSAFPQPVILVDSHHELFDSIAVDNRKGGEMAVTHLLQTGFRRIGLVTANLAAVPARDRKIGYKRALQKAGIPFDPTLVVESKDVVVHGFSEECGYEDTLRLLAQAQDIDAIFATSDVQALGALRAFREVGLRCPEDIALMGYDDVKLAAFAGLSTIRQPMNTLGNLAVEYFFKRLEDPNAEVTHISLRPEVVARNTSAKLG